MNKRKRALTELFETVSLGAPEKAVGFVLWRVVHRYLREVDRALVALELTHLKFMTLMVIAWLERDEQPVTQSELARFSGIHPMQVSHILKTLEAQQFVTRQRSLSDIRAKRIEITTAGIRVLRSALPRVIDVQQRLFGQAGRPGGPLLNTLLRFDAEAVDRGS